MTLQQYEEKFHAQLIDNWRGGSWSKYIRERYQKYMDNMDEQKITEWENRQC